MNHKLRILSLVTLLGCFAMLPLAHADDIDHETLMTIQGTVALPGVVLQPGQYVFKLADGSTGQDVVRIFNADQSQIITTVFVVPALRAEPTADSVITLEELPGSGHEAIGKWFFAGDREGVEFMYR